MKYFQAVILTLFITCWISLSGNDKPENYSPIIFIEDTIVDFKTVQEGDNLTRQIKVKNLGSRELKISNVRGSCGLMVISFPRNDIFPGDSALISFRYDSSRVGEFERFLTIHSNSPENTVRILVKGKVIKEK